MTDLAAALAIVRAAGYRVRKPGRSRLVYDKAKRMIVTQQLNAVGKPYGVLYDPKYRIKTPLTSINRLRKPWIVPPPYVGDASDGRFKQR
jgi:hypothetical protein